MGKRAKAKQHHANQHSDYGDDESDATGSGWTKKSVPETIPEAGETLPSDSHAEPKMDEEETAEVFLRQTHYLVKKSSAKLYPRLDKNSTTTKKRSVTLPRAHNNMLAQMTHDPCSTACSPTAILTCLATLLMSLQLTRPNPPSTCPTQDPC
jgi:hypothetical protein